MKDLTNQIQTELIARLDWIGILANNNQDAPGASEQTTPRIRLLDYACGSGELSRVSRTNQPPLPRNSYRYSKELTYMNTPDAPPLRVGSTGHRCLRRHGPRIQRPCPCRRDT